MAWLICYDKMGQYDMKMKWNVLDLALLFVNINRDSVPDWQCYLSLDSYSMYTLYPVLLTTLAVEQTNIFSKTFVSKVLCFLNGGFCFEFRWISFHFISSTLISSSTDQPGHKERFAKCPAIDDWLNMWANVKILTGRYREILRMT